MCIHRLAEPPDPRDLFIQNFMQDRLNAVCFRAGTDNRPDAVRQSTAGRVTKRTVHDRDDFICMAFHESAYQRFLVGKVLIERADADTSPLRHSSGGRSLISILDQNLSRCDQDGLNGGLRSFLPRQFSWICVRQRSEEHTSELQSLM